MDHIEHLGLHPRLVRFAGLVQEADDDYCEQGWRGESNFSWNEIAIEKNVEASSVEEAIEALAGDIKDKLSGEPERLATIEKYLCSRGTLYLSSPEQKDFYLKRGIMDRKPVDRVYIR